tara:strand:+ start:840 stop:1199 length:360 start_codon:yes stop_codon:yes gene_type:complete
MKAYFINAKDELIVETDIKNWDHKKELIGARMLERYPYSVNGNDLWTNEEALFGDYSYDFVIDNCIVHGNAVVLGTDDEKHESIDVNHLTLINLKSRVKFLGKRWIDHDRIKFQVMEWK